MMNVIQVQLILKHLVQTKHKIVVKKITEPCVYPFSKFFFSDLTLCPVELFLL